MIRVSSPVQDLAHFIYTSTDKQFRDKYYLELNDLYYDTLASFLEKLGGNPETQFPKSELREQWRKCGRVGLAMGIFACPLNTHMYSMANPDVDTSSDERRKLYRERMNGVFDDIIQYC